MGGDFAPGTNFIDEKKKNKTKQGNKQKRNNANK